MAISLSISNWSGWIQQQPLAVLVTSNHITRSTLPDVADIPAMLRRRLNLPGRAAAAQAMKLLAGKNDTAIVYGSRHGDIERTLGILKDIADDNPVSPMHFSLSVHNAIPGVISIHGGITANISSIVAGEEGVLPVLFEAAGLLSEGYRHVLCIICDVALPDIYRFGSDNLDDCFAVCFVVTADEGLALRLKYESTAANDVADMPEKPSPLLFAEFLEADVRTMPIRHNNACWLLHKQ